MATWTWRLQDSQGRGDETSEAFPSQGDAESWVGEHWPALLERGVEAVTLLEGEREVYGPMSLRPE